MSRERMGLHILGIYWANVYKSPPKNAKNRLTTLLEFTTLLVFEAAGRVCQGRGLKGIFGSYLGDVYQKVLKRLEY